MLGPQQPFFDDSHNLVLENSQASTSDVAAPKFIRERVQTYTPPSIRDTGTLRPGPEWYPAWMQYRRREANYVFWQDKFSRCSIDVPGVHAGHGLCSQTFRAMCTNMHPGIATTGSMVHPTLGARGKFAVIHAA